MAFSNKLHNPTPFLVKFNYHRGIDIKIDPFSSVDLPMTFVEDFVKGQPGSEEVYNELSFYGVFLEDPNRSYEAQAADALRGAIKGRETIVREVTDNIRKSMAAMGASFDQAVVDEQLSLSGVMKLKDEAAELKDLVSVYDNVVQTQKPTSSIKAYDLTRTVLVLDPPKEFPTKEAMEFFLNRNPEIKQKHLEMVGAMNTPKRSPGRPPKEAVSTVDEQAN